MYSELLMNKIMLILYKTWYEVSYSHSKILRIIETEVVIYKKESELKKAEKLVE